MLRISAHGIGRSDRQRLESAKIAPTPANCRPAAIRMRTRQTKRRGWTLRDVLLVMTFVNYLVAVVGVPLPTHTTGSRGTSDFPYPCQDHACGCGSSEECWKGDCCCFTLEQKLVWAETRGLEPPDHVRPLVEARKGKIEQHHRKSCCEPTSSAADSLESKEAGDLAPCESGLSATIAPKHCHESTSECSDCHTEPPHASHSGVSPIKVKWIIGIFAQRCRGLGPTGLLQLQIVGLASVLGLNELPLIPDCWLNPGESVALSLPIVPLAPPPRFV